jgi:hypothetical protein
MKRHHSFENYSSTAKKGEALIYSAKVRDKMAKATFSLVQAPENHSIWKNLKARHPKIMKRQ